LDLTARTHWYEYSQARDKMMDAADTGIAPWDVVDNNEKRQGRLNCIAHLLSQIPYELSE
jgi:polyphosphate kinase 2 (PPK2 family)